MPEKKRKRKRVDGPSHISRGNVFDDLGFSVDELPHIKLRANLLIEVMKIIENKGYDQRALQKILDVPQSRVSELMTGKISKMSAEKLVSYLDKLGGMITSIAVTFGARAPLHPVRRG